MPSPKTRTKCGMREWIPDDLLSHPAAHDERLLLSQSLRPVPTEGNSYKFHFGAKYNFLCCLDAKGEWKLFPNDALNEARAPEVLRVSVSALTADGTRRNFPAVYAAACEAAEEQMAFERRRTALMDGKPTPETLKRLHALAVDLYIAACEVAEATGGAEDFANLDKVLGKVLSSEPLPTEDGS